MKKPFPYAPYPPSKPIEPVREIVEWVVIFEEQLGEYNGRNWQEFQAVVQSKIPSNIAPEDITISTRTDKTWYYDDCTVDVYVVIKQKQIKQKSDYGFNKEMKIYKNNLKSHKAEYGKYKEKKKLWDNWEKEEKALQINRQITQLEKQLHDMKNGKKVKELEKQLENLKKQQ